jgi:hypothetical protein
MPLNIGNATATSGMAQSIYLAIDAQLRPPLEAQDPPMGPDQIEPIQEKWRELSFAIATGVVHHLRRQPPSTPDYAEVFSSDAEDGEFWDWLAEFADLLGDWAGSGPVGTIDVLRTDLSAFLSANPVPRQLRGILR